MADRTESSALDSLREHLRALGPGPVDRGCLLEVLVLAWPEIDGGHEHAMAVHKLARMERPAWHAPVLEFEIERHGGTVLGSTRAERQWWRVDIERATADCEALGHRQLVKAAPRWDATSSARDVAELIRTGTRDPRAVPSALGVRVVTKEVIPAGGKQTTDGRRRRFYDKLDAMLAPEWRRSGSTYCRRGDA